MILVLNEMLENWILVILIFLYYLKIQDFLTHLKFIPEFKEKQINLLIELEMKVKNFYPEHPLVNKIIYSINLKSRIITNLV